MADIEQFVRDLNRAWRDRRFEDLCEYFHHDVVLLPPGTDEPIVGIEPMIQSYRQFDSVATVHAFEIHDLTAYEFGALAICHLRFEVDYEMESGRFHEKGLEVYAIESSGTGPRVVWRTQIAREQDSA